MPHRRIGFEAWSKERFIAGYDDIDVNGPSLSDFAFSMDITWTGANDSHSCPILIICIDPPPT